MRPNGIPAAARCSLLGIAAACIPAGTQQGALGGHAVLRSINIVAIDVTRITPLKVHIGEYLRLVEFPVAPSRVVSLSQRFLQFALP
jgi:hypothetical protein